MLPARSYNPGRQTRENEGHKVQNPSTGRAPNARRLHAVLVVVTCAVAIAACGSSGRPSAAAGGGDPLVKYAQCLRTHGVPNFPDPSGSNGLVIPNNINPNAPAFQSAQKACAKLAQGSGSGSGHGSSSESQKLQLLAFAGCMRKHGVPNFPDPTSSPPPPGNGNVIGGNGAYLAIGPPASHQSPAFRNAAATCHIP